MKKENLSNFPILLCLLNHYKVGKVENARTLTSQRKTNKKKKKENSEADKGSPESKKSTSQFSQNPHTTR